MTKENVCRDICILFHSTEDCDEKCKRSIFIKRQRKAITQRHKQKCEYRHDQKGYENVFNQVSVLKKAFKKRSESKAKDEKKTIEIVKISWKFKLKSKKCLLTLASSQ